jgi:predicted MFS family arabinose efflux permease
MLLVLISGFALSQAFRTVPAIMSTPLQQAFGLSPQQLGLFAAAFHFSFGALQFFMGIGLDVYGSRRTVLFVFPLAIAGALVIAAAPNYPTLILGQVLTGIGCAPAFLACTLFISRNFPSDRYASINGAALGIGSIGLLMTGTPLAWIIQTWGWRTGFAALAACALLAWLAILLLVREAPPAHAGERASVLGTLRGYGELFRLPQTAGIIALALFTYASFISLRGLWIGPLLIDRYGFTLVQTGNMVVAVSVLGMFGPPVFGRLDPGDARRRRWILGYTLACAALFLALMPASSAPVQIALALGVSLISGYMVMQYADVRAAYPARMHGRALAVFTMAMFLGVALMQWLTGLAASAAVALKVDVYATVMGSIAFLLLLGAAAYRLLPQPQDSAVIDEPAQSAP